MTANSAISNVSDYRILAKPNHILSIFVNQQQWDFFSAFIFTNQQAGTVPVNTLQALVPQVAHGDALIREVCLAVGAAVGPCSDVNSGPLTDELLSRTSLMHYNRAASIIRGAKATGETLAAVAVASILFVAYDLLRGDISGAFVHFSHGRRIVDSYFDRRCKERGVTLHRLPMSSLEEALYEVVQRLTTYSWALELGFTGPRTDQTHMYCERRSHRHRLEDIPTWFRDLAHALTWWDVVQHHLYHHDLAKEEGHQTPDKGTSWERSTSLLQQWHNSFLPLLQSARQHRTQDLHNCMSTCILEAVYLEALANLHLKFRSNSTVLPDNRSIYLEIVQAAREMQQGWDKSLGIAVLDNAISRPLVFVIYRCRDASIRKEIQELLLSFDPSSQLALPLLAMLNQEEGKEMPPKLMNIVRTLGWNLTACGCNPGGYFP